MNKQTHYYSCKCRHDLLSFSNTLYDIICHYEMKKNPLVLLCIGTDKVTGDCLGPLVGHQLTRLLAGHALPIKLFGTLQSPVHAVNMKQQLKRISDELSQTGKQMNDSIFIVIDASLGFSDHIGYVTLSEQPLCPGEGVNKKLPQVGQISITGITGEAHGSSYKSQLALRHAKLYDLMQLSDFISLGIYNCLSRLFLTTRFYSCDSICHSSEPLLVHEINEQL